MVCIDGFILTHTVDPVDVPGKGDVDKFLPPYKPDHAYLDPKRPMSIGTFTDPNYYMEARHDMELALEGAKDVIAKANAEFAEIFGRKYDFIEKYRSDDADTIIVAMGSICSTIKDVVDEHRDNGEKVGLVRVRVFRPFQQKKYMKRLKVLQILVFLIKIFHLVLAEYYTTRSMLRWMLKLTDS
jgi:pyruvate ferredoxin oxidoreductase alpha subunit